MLFALHRKDCGRRFVLPQKRGAACDSRRVGKRKIHDSKRSHLVACGQLFCNRANIVRGRGFSQKSQAGESFFGQTNRVCSARRSGVAQPVVENKNSNLRGFFSIRTETHSRAKESVFRLQSGSCGIENGEEILEKYPFEISGGEAQRVVLAIAMCANAKLIVADEATRGIDQETSETFWNCINSDFQNTALIIVTHDMTVAKKCDYVLVLKDGCVQEYGKTCEVFSNPKSEYAKSLISACEVSYA